MEKFCFLKSLSRSEHRSNLIRVIILFIIYDQGGSNFKIRTTAFYTFDKNQGRLCILTGVDHTNEFRLNALDPHPGQDIGQTAGRINEDQASRLTQHTMGGLNDIAQICFDFMAGNSTLYTREYFAMCRKHLRPGGVASMSASRVTNGLARLFVAERV